MSTDPRPARLTALLALGRVVPVITINRLEDAVPLARALVEGGVRLLEVTLRTPAGMAGAEAIMRQPNVVAVGGSWLTPAAEIAAGQWDAIRTRAARTRARLERVPGEGVAAA